MTRSNIYVSKEQKVYSTFQTISEDYDKVNDVISFSMHRFWKRDAIRRLNIRKGSKILDVCCGTGDLSIMVSKSEEDIQVVGLDFSENMLDVAKKRINDMGIDNIELIHGNAMKLPFEDNSFDFVAVGFGLRNTPDYQKAIMEMMRVVKPGGKVACLDTSMPDMPIYREIFAMYFKHLMPIVGNILSKHKEEYKWLNNSTETFLSKKELKKLYEKVGLKSVFVKSYAGGAAALHIGTKEL